jgi:hypothetical protein
MGVVETKQGTNMKTLKSIAVVMGLVAVALIGTLAAGTFSVIGVCVAVSCFSILGLTCMMSR